jgi:hypothetical protein
MDTAKILADLHAERDRISQAISALEALNGTPMTRKSPGRPKGSAKRTAKLETARMKKRNGGITAAGRRRLSEMMKKRWAERKKAAKPKTRAAAA